MDWIEMKKHRLLEEKTQAEVARDVGVSLTTYRNWEQGVGNPTAANLKKLKKALKVS